MKKISILVIFLSFLLTQNTDTQSTSTQNTDTQSTSLSLPNSFGLDFHTFPYTYLDNDASYYDYNDNDIPTLFGFYFSFITSNNLTIEPYYAFYKIEQERDYDSDEWQDDYKSSVSMRTFTVGVFKNKANKDSRIYYGARIGKKWYQFDTDQEGAEDYERDSFILAPTFGAEYFIAESFSFGGEVSYNIETEENTEASSYYDLNTSTSSVLPKFIVRFYF